MAKILFLEDDRTIREVLSEYMSVTGYEVIEFEDGDTAFEFIEQKSTNFDIAVLDIRVPGKTGLDILQQIKACYGDIVGTIMLTAYDDISTQIEAFNYLADDYITKPASPIILLKRIEALLRRINKIKSIEAIDRQQVLNVNNYVNLESKNMEADSEALIVDEEGYRVFFKGENLRLTVSEFSLMKTLKGHPGRVYSRDMLINQIFDEDYMANDRIIDAHVKNLRKKLPKDYIETVIGIGYRWRDEK